MSKMRIHSEKALARAQNLRQGGQLQNARGPATECPEDSVVFVNGMITDLDLHRSTLTKLGPKAVGIYNATEGFVGDLWQSTRDKCGWRKNPATLATLEVMRKAAQDKKPLQLFGHSQGTVIIGNALKQLRREMKDEGFSRRDIDVRMGRFTVTTMGGALYKYPRGPRYHHYLNLADPVTWMVGLSATAWAACGAREKVTSFYQPVKPHAVETYLEARRVFS